MKTRIFSWILAAGLAVSLSAPAFAAELSQATDIAATISGKVDILYNGVEQKFTDEQGNTVLPLFYGGTTYLPVRAICNLVGMGVSYDGADYAVKLTSAGEKKAFDGTVDAPETTVSAMIVPELTVSLDGVAQHFKDAGGSVVYPVAYNGTTYLPVRAIAGLAGLEVGWDGATSTVSLSSKGAGGVAGTIPAGAHLPTTVEMKNGGYEKNRYMTDEELKAFNAQNGVSMDFGENLLSSTALELLSLDGKYKSVTFTVIAPNGNKDVHISVPYGKTVFTTSCGSVDNVVVKAGTSMTLTSELTGANVAGISVGFDGNETVYLTNIYFE